MWDKLLDPQNGVAGLLAGLIIILALHLFFHIGRFAIELWRKKSDAAEQELASLMHSLKAATDQMQSLSTRILAIERDLNEVLKFKIDFRRLFSAVKFIAGDKWPEAKKAMKDYEFD